MGSGVRTGVASKECAKQGLKCHGVQKMRMLACQRVHGGVREIGEGWGLEIKEEGGGFAKTLFSFIFIIIYLYVWKFVNEKKHFKIPYNQVHQWLGIMYIH